MINLRLFSNIFSKWTLTFVLPAVVAPTFMGVLVPHVHGHLGGALLPVVRVLHVGDLFTVELLQGESLLTHAHVLDVLHGLVVLRVRLVAIVRPTVDNPESYKLQSHQEEGGREGSHGRGLQGKQRGKL